MPTSRALPAEHKATVLKIFSFANPHMRAFHLGWWAFFATFFSTFAPAPLLPYIKRSLNLTKPELSHAAMGSVGSTVVFRVICTPLRPPRSPPRRTPATRASLPPHAPQGATLRM